MGQRFRALLIRFDGMRSDIGRAAFGIAIGAAIACGLTQTPAEIARAIGLMGAQGIAEKVAIAALVIWIACGRWRRG
jgi:hypothetical protein